MTIHMMYENSNANTAKGGVDLNGKGGEGDRNVIAVEKGKGISPIVIEIEEQFGGKVNIEIEGEDAKEDEGEEDIEVVLTCVGPHIGNYEIAEIVSHVATHGGRMEGVRSLAKRKSGIGQARALELRIWMGKGGIEELRERLKVIGRRLDVDVVVQRESVFRRRKRLALFDLDSTLIAQETIDEIAAEAGVEEEVSRITVRAMNGEIDFKDALRERVKLITGLPVSKLDAIKERVRYTPGARELIRALSTLGCTTAVVSGGFEFLANHVRDELGLDHAFSNKLEIGANGKLTGRLEYPIVDADFKASVVTMLTRTKGVRKEQVMAIGDGSNDLKMMAAAGLGVAFNAKPKVQKMADCTINQRSLASVLFLLGLTNNDIDNLLSTGR